MFTLSDNQIKLKLDLLKYAKIFKFLFFLQVLLVFISCNPDQKRIQPPENLLCEYQMNPIGIDILKPRFYWQLNDQRRGAKQTAYQILVSSERETLENNKGNIWDSGKVIIDQSIHVDYKGIPLISTKKYFWKVRIWDKDGLASSYSEIAFWEMGLLSKIDWKANWIEIDEEKIKGNKIPMGKWIWHSEEEKFSQHVFFRTTFIVEKGKNIQDALVRLTADDSFILHINGKTVGKHEQWRDLMIYDIKSALQPGENTIAVEVIDKGGTYGFVLGSVIKYKDNTSQLVATDDNWQSSTIYSKNWKTYTLNNTNWKNASVLQDYGKPDWGFIEYRKPAKSYYLRKKFNLSNKIKKARVYISGLGLYECWINGKKVGEDELTPGWTRFPTRVQYQTYDVTKLLKKDNNVIGVILGNGWWGSVMGGNWRNGPPRMICQLDISIDDNNFKQIVSDKSWKSDDSPILENSLFDGEFYDARLEQEGWNQPYFNDQNWTDVKLADNRSTTTLVAQSTPSMKVIEQLKPISISEPKPGVYIYDFGQNHAGRIKLKIKGKAGRRIQIRHSEILNEDGTLNVDNYRMAKATDNYILKGHGEEVYEPHFTYRGFRYAEITGYPEKPVKDAIISQVIHNNATLTGSFKCSNPLLNKIYKSILWGQKSNMYSVPTDCPQRNERFGWTGDAQVSAPTACWNMNMSRFYSKWMRDLRDSQNPEGIIQNINPTLENKTSSPGWGDAAIIIPWTVYNFYGDKRIITDNYSSMKNWIDYMQSKATNGVLYDVAGYGDWLAVERSPEKPIGAAYYYHSTKLFAEMAGIVDQKNDARIYTKLSEGIAKAFHETYADNTGNYPGKTQTSYILPLCFDLVPENNRNMVFENLLDKIKEQNNHLSTGFMGTANIMEVLSENHAHELAYQIASQDTYPSWGYMVKNNGTTIWEHWNSNLLDEVDPSMNSFNHIALGTINKWFFDTLAGIKFDTNQPGFKHIIIRPRPAGDLTWTEATFNSLYGPIHIRWEKKENLFLCRVTIPANTSATIYLPSKIKDNLVIFESGEICFKNETGYNKEGLNYIRSTKYAEVFFAEAGTYEFKLLVN